jgi:hypothetical protein
LAVSPFASPVLKHPCTARDDEDDATPLNLHCKSPSTTCISSAGVSSLTEVTEDSNLVQPLCLADLCTQTSDLTGVTSTTCTGYFNELCLEDSDTVATSSTNGNRPYPLHSTAQVTHFGSTELTNWHETPVPFSTRNGNLTQISGASQIHVSVSGTGGTRCSGVDSGVGVSAELNTPTSDQATNEGRELATGSRSQPTKCGVSIPGWTEPVSSVLTTTTTAPGAGTSSSRKPTGSAAKHGSILSTIHEGIPSIPTGVYVSVSVCVCMYTYVCV